MAQYLAQQAHLTPAADSGGRAEACMPFSHQERPRKTSHAVQSRPACGATLAPTHQLHVMVAWAPRNAPGSYCQDLPFGPLDQCSPPTTP